MSFDQQWEVDSLGHESTFSPGLPGSSIKLSFLLPNTCLSGLDSSSFFLIQNLKIFLFIYLFLFLAMMGLHCCAQGFCSCNRLRLHFIAMWRLLIGAEYRLYAWASIVVPKHVVSSSTRDWTHVPCLGRWILFCWTTKGVLSIGLLSEEQPNMNLVTPIPYVNITSQGTENQTVRKANKASKRRQGNIFIGLWKHS